MRLHSGAFFFAQGSLVFFRLALNVFVQGFFFWRQHDERQRLYASGFAACKKGLRVDIAQPDGGCRCCK